MTLTAAVVVLVTVLMASLPGRAATPDQAASVAVDRGLPRVLSAADADLYERIFVAQITGKWRQADRLIAKLSDQQLLGHVKLQRYMHPNAYRARYAELHHWLLAYADHPGATRIYKLAKRRHLKNWKRPTAPKRPVMNKQARRLQPADAVANKRRSAASKGKRLRLPRSVRIKIHRYFRRGRPDLAEKYINDKRVQRHIGRRRIDQARTLVATGYLRAGNNRKALEMASEAAARSRQRVPSADRIAGLAAWRAGFGERAAMHFGKLAGSSSASDRARAAGAYWAARTLLRDGAPDQVRHYLNLAASFPRTLYGLLACRQLAMAPDLSWRAPTLTDAQLKILMTLPAVRRAIALSEAGQQHLADAEISRLHRYAPAGLRHALFALAVRLPAPATAMRIAKSTLRDGGPFYDLALYPVLNAADTEKLDLDRALIHAFVRQESNFNTRAKSRVGARGLMQIMPNTASFVGADRSLKWSGRANLYDPVINLRLGDKYLNHLLNLDPIDGNLIKLVAAYNGGPGNLRKWLRALGRQDDPLVFLETIPSRETRNFTEKVLTNLWIYRLRLGQPQPSLDALASGQWPRYQSTDQAIAPVAQN